MNHPRVTTLRIGAWLVDATTGQISRTGETQRLDARALGLLLHLARKPGETVSIEELLSEVWTGVVVTPDSVYQAVASLRRLLGDDPKQPTYIATVPRLGYRMVAAVVASPESAGDVAPAHSRRRAALLFGAGAAIVAALVAVAALRDPADRAAVASDSASPGRHQSIAVLPFLDLTEQMDQEIFVDGMTEELVDKLSRIPGLRVPPARSSFQFKGQGAKIADIATALRVAYVIDGSVRKSGDTVRVAARLVRADDGYIVWSQTYDRPFDDVLMIQEDIAAEVAQSLRPKVTSQEPEKTAPE
jgi:TolB-like protein/DNA-binding winged helix-turn-helix (wHTH) protein